MMKKALIMASLLVFAASVNAYAADTPELQKVPDTQQNKPCDLQRPPKGPDFAKRNAEFEKRLKLTDKQKAKAEELRKQSFEQMKPLMDKIKEKEAQLDAVKRSKIAEEDQKVKIDQLNKEIGALKRATHELRMQNMKDFEAILTKKQTKELKKMKDEGRKKFDKEHKRGAQFGPNGPRPEGPCPPPPPEAEK